MSKNSVSGYGHGLVRGIILDVDPRVACRGKKRYDALYRQGLGQARPVAGGQANPSRRKVGRWNAVRLPRARRCE